MIPVLLTWFIKKYLPRAKKTTRIIILGLLFPVPVMAQEQVSRYNVLYKGNNIGNMILRQTKNDDELTVKIASNIQMRMIMSVNVNVVEDYSYMKSQLMHSSVLRKVNGSEKINRQTDFNNNIYHLTTEGKKSILNKEIIEYNLAKLYLAEPIGIQQVYSDNFQQFLNIKNIGNHNYKLQLPGSNYNIYCYENKICKRIEVHNTFYTIQMQLAE